jgi:DNA-binding beta-propeller fold protein YncE
VTTPAGTVLPLAGKATAIVADDSTHTLAVAVSSPPSLVLFSLTDLKAAPRTVPLPGVTEHLALAGPGGPVLAAVPSADQVVKVALPSGTTSVVPVKGGPTSAIEVNHQLLAALPDQHGVAVLDAAGKPVRTVTGAVDPELLVAAGGKPVLLDRLDSAVYDVDAAGSIGAGLRAGDGATNAAVDPYGRIVVTDTRSGELLEFSADPVLLLQRYPVPGVPYGVAVDGPRDLAWVTLTQTNEVIGYDIRGGQPAQKYRLPTVRQPDSVAVDPGSGRVFVASADGGGVQVVQP